MEKKTCLHRKQSLKKRFCQRFTLELRGVFY